MSRKKNAFSVQEYFFINKSVGIEGLYGLEEGRRFVGGSVEASAHRAENWYC